MKKLKPLSSLALACLITGIAQAQVAITSFSPTSGSPGTTVTITGSNLAQVNSAWVGGAHDVKVVSASATKVQVQIPGDATTGEFALGNGSSWGFSSGTFTVTSASGPVGIASFTPASGAPGTVVTIKGSNLAHVNTVWLGAARDVRIMSASATQVQVQIPADATNGELALSNGSSWGFSPGTFTVTRAASGAVGIASFSPASGKAGTVVTVNGSNLAGVNTVWLGAAHDVKVLSTSATQVQVQIPADATSGELALSNGSSWGFSPTPFTVLTGTSGSSSSGSSTSSSSSSSSGSSSSGGTSSSGSSSSGSSPAAVLAAKLGRPARLLVGLGSQSTVDAISTSVSYGIKPDIYDQYLVGASSAGDWTTWNSPKGAYINVVTNKADSVGAIPMFTLYQMATDGGGNMTVLTNSTFMTTYWSNVRLMLQLLAQYGKPALINAEPDFWGYAQNDAPNHDATQMAALVTINPDCTDQPNTVVGFAGCLIEMTHKYTTKTFIGFPVSTWGGPTNASVVAFMNAVGAQHADFIVAQTYDRDAGCFELQDNPAGCVRDGSGWYWDATNQTHPSFADYFALAQAWHTGIGNLPLVWWQTPMGVPSSTPGGTLKHFRDNKEQYFLTHGSQLTAIGGLGVVFSDGNNDQTDMATDGGQFQSLFKSYMAAPAPLP